VAREPDPSIPHQHQFNASQSEVRIAMAKSRGKSRPTIDLQTASDTGSSSRDNLTADTTLNLSGKTEPGARLSIFDGSTLLGTVKARRDGTWSFTGPELAEGEHVLTVVVRDGGSKVTSKPLTVTVDTTAPDAPGLTLDAGSDTGSDPTDRITSDTTPTLTGTAEARAVIVISNGATVLGTTTADAKGAWSFTVGALGEGDHSLTATANDRAGNVGTAPATLALTIDTTAPVAPTIDLDATSDTGTSATDNVTKNTTPRLTGTAEAGATVTIIINGSTVLGTAVADASGAWSFTSPALAEGAHILTAEATDAAGNSGDRSSALSVTIDASSATPTLAMAAASDTGISSTDGITSDTTPTLTGTAEAGATVTIKDGTTVLGTAVADGTGSWSFTTGTLSTGSHSLTATATDTAGNASAASTPVVITVDTTAPGTATIDLAAASDTGTSSTDNNTYDTTPTVTGTAEAGATVTIKDGTVVLGTTTADSTGAWSFTTGVLPAGGRLLTATASDAAGNTGTTSSYVAVTIDPYAPSTPTIDLDAGSDTGSSTTDHVTSDTTPTVSGTAEGGATITIYNGTTVLGTTTAASLTGAWSFTPTALPAGSYTLTATATDSAGNVSAESGAIAVLIDTGTQTPTIDLAAGSDTGPNSADNITSDTTPSLTGTAEGGSTVTIRDGLTVLGTTVANGSGQWNYTTGTLAEGGHSLTATATDVAGNTSATSAALVITIDTTAPIAPTIDLDAGSDLGSSATDDLTADTTPTLTGTTEAGATVTISNGSTVLGTAVADANGDWSFTTDTLLDGSHSLSATTTDVAGNTGASSPALSVTIDTTAPAVPTIDLDAASDTGSDSTDNITSDATPTLTGTAEAGATVTIRIGSTVLGTTVADNAGTWSFTTDALTDDLHSLTAMATDAAGNSSTVATLDVTVGVERYDLTSLSATEGFVIQGDAAGDSAGWSVSSAGDVNGDGFADLIIGAYNGDDGGADAGEAYVVFGSATGFGTADGTGRQVIDLTTLSATEGYIIQGDADGDNAGFGVSSAGDVNGDGFDDVMVGAWRAGDGGLQNGRTYVVFGSSSSFGTPDGTGRQVMDVSTLSETQGFIIQGSAAFERAGWSVSSAGDVNGDGFDDMIVGAAWASNGGSVAGEAYVVFGSASGFGAPDGTGRQVLDLATLSATQGFMIQGDSAADYAGWSVSSAGDVNGDGFDDVIVGARRGDDGGYDAGEAYIVFGSASGFGTDDGTGRQMIDLTTLSAAQGFIFRGDASNETAGSSVSAAGDINGDGIDDLIVGVPWGSGGGHQSGEAYVVFGSTSGFGTADGDGRRVIEPTTLSATQGFVIMGSSFGAAGWSVSSAGDVNGDGLGDLIVGAPWGSGNDTQEGLAYVVFGSASGFGTVDGDGRQVLNLGTLSAAQGFVIQGDAWHDNAGASVSAAGDINGDGFDDVIVGAAYGDDGGDRAGEAYVIYGSALGGSTLNRFLTGTGLADTLIGSTGDDVISGLGGADVLSGGSGHDWIAVTDGTFGRISGGGGTDTLVFDGADISIDFTQIANSRISGIERLDLTGTGDNTATLGIDDVFLFSTTKDPQFTEATLDEALVVEGDAGDVLNLLQGSGSWALANQGLGIDGSIPGPYDIYIYTVSGSTRAFLAVDDDVAVNFV
jgi:hypothetical protein